MNICFKKMVFHTCFHTCSALILPAFIKNKLTLFRFLFRPPGPRAERCPPAAPQPDPGQHRLHHAWAVEEEGRRRRNRTRSHVFENCMCVGNKNVFVWQNYVCRYLTKKINS